MAYRPSRPRNHKWHPSRNEGVESYTTASYAHQTFRTFKSLKGRKTWENRISRILKERVDLTDAKFEIDEIWRVNIWFDHAGRKYRLYKAGERIRMSHYVLQKFSQ